MPIIPIIWGLSGLLTGWFLSGDKIEQQNNNTGSGSMNTAQNSTQTIIYVLLCLLGVGLVIALIFWLKNRR